MEREREREEVFERIPWETLDRPPRDNNRLVMGVAAAVVLGALAFSFMRNQPAVMVPETAPVVATPTTPQATIQAPILRSEADLYAVDQTDLERHAAVHAEWFAVELMSYDGSDTSRMALESLMPEGVPLPEAPEGTQVFVDWVGSVSTTQLAPLQYQVEVVVRTMAAAAGEGFRRQPPTRMTVEVLIGADGQPRVVRPPQIDTGIAPTPHPMDLASLPETLSAEVEELFGTVVGGEMLPDGRWRVVVMVADHDGVTRPQTVVVP